jgi:hypothetical protein
MKTIKNSSSLALHKKTIARYAARNNGNKRHMMDTSTLTISTIRRSENN